MRAGFGGVYALDFPTFMRFGELRGLPAGLVADVLPDIEAILLSAYREMTDVDND